MTQRWRVIVPLIVLCAALVPAAADTEIQPGAPVQIAGNGCTLNFVFKDGGKTYIGTAGHCGSVPQRAWTEGNPVGTIRYSRNDDVIDFALIEVDANRVGNVSASVRGWGGPKGATDESETATGDEVWVYGYGIVVGTLAKTRARQGVLVNDTDTHYRVDMPAVNGDSGGPILHAKTGKALGIVSKYGIVGLPPTTDEGPTVEHILRTLAAAGFPVTLQTA